MNQGASSKETPLDTLSFIRTMTVGFGITPNLLTSLLKSARGLPDKSDYRQWGITPRPEIAEVMHPNHLSGKAI